MTAERPRAYPLDGALLLFDRETGINMRFDGEDFAGLRQNAPRSIQFGITNLCNMACQFCSRDQTATSAWTAGEAFDLLAGLADAGALEVAFGGGEPFAFGGFEDLVRRLHDETPLAVHATTNGRLVTRRRLAAIRGKLGELRLSLYDDNDWRRTIALLVEEGVRFGINLLVLPERLSHLEAWIFELVELGCSDILLLSYNGPDRARHLSHDQAAALEERLGLLHRAVGARARLSLDVCWGERLVKIPRLFERDDCGAGRDFVVITSDKQLLPCSFHHIGFPIRSASDVMQIWHERRVTLAGPSRIAGCARADGYGLETTDARPRLERLRLK